MRWWQLSWQGFSLCPWPPEQFCFCFFVYYDSAQNFVCRNTEFHFLFFKKKQFTDWMMWTVPSNTGNELHLEARLQVSGCNMGSRSEYLPLLGARTLTPLFSRGFEQTVASVNSWIQYPIVCQKSPATLFPLKASSATSLPHLPRTEVDTRGNVSVPLLGCVSSFHTLSRTSREFLLSKVAYQKQFGRV